MELTPVEHLCAELTALRERYRPDGFESWDEHFPLDVAWLEEFARQYPARVGLPFKLEMHPRAATRQRLELVARAGCSLFHCGVESGDDELRRGTLDRRTRDAELLRVFDERRALGLPTSASVMTALPGETREQALSTVSLLRRLRPDSFMWSTYLPLPRTPLGDASVSDFGAESRVRFDDYDKPVSSMPLQVLDRVAKAAAATALDIDALRRMVPA